MNFFARKNDFVLFFRKILNTNLDAGVYSLVFFIATIVGARYLSLAEFGLYSILFSVYLLLQGIYYGAIGELILSAGRWEDNVPEYLKGYALFLMAIAISFFSLLAIPFLITLDLTAFEIILYLLSSVSLIFLNNARYCFHADDLHFYASIVSIAFFIGTITSIFFLESIVDFMFFKDVSGAIKIFVAFGLSSLVVNLFAYSNLHINMQAKNLKKQWELYGQFTNKSVLLSIVFWIAGNLHWVILGAFYSPIFLGIMRGCLAIINPLQVIDRALTVSLLSAKRKNGEIKVILKRHLYIAWFIYFFIIGMWFAYSDLIILVTIGEKFIEYKNTISVLIFIPVFQVCFSLCSATLKSLKIFMPQIFIQVFVPIVILIFIIFAKDGEKAILLAAGILGVNIFTSISLLLYMKKSKNISQRLDYD